MMDVTQWMTLSDEEVLRMFDEKRRQSPVVAELCRRLEQAIQAPITAVVSSECPVCFAQLELSAAEDDELFTLKVAN